MHTDKRAMENMIIDDVNSKLSNLSSVISVCTHSTSFHPLSPFSQAMQVRGKIFFFFLLLTLISCKSIEKPNWQERLRAKENIRFQIPVFEIENLTGEKRISLSNEFALLWTKHSGYQAVVLDQKIKENFIRRNEPIPSTNFAIQSKFSNRVLRLLVVDLETGEILSYGKIELSTEEELPKQFEMVIEEQLLK